jgi:membrane-associated protease RseP (regulator of RpoE activity)
MQHGKLAGMFMAAGLAFGSIAQAQDAGRSPDANPFGNGAPLQSPMILPAGHSIWFGIEASPVPPALAHQLRLDQGAGLLIEHIDPGSPAAKAGIREYDVLQKLNDRSIVNAREFASQLRARQPGDAVKLTLVREGQPVEVNVILGEHATVPQEAPGRDRPMSPEAAEPAPRRHPRGLQIPKIKVRIDNGDLIATDESGHTLFRQPLDFTLDNDDLPFSIHVRVKPDRSAGTRETDPHPAPAPSDRQEP